jgi:prepilin signal peptidase PulO-like enzyme (type II secretory pathway)
MLLETFLANQLKNEHFSNDDATYVSFVLLLIIYAIFTIFIAIRYPVANNILISLLLAILITPVFWILKIIELIAGTTLDRLSNNRRRT